MCRGQGLFFFSHFFLKSFKCFVAGKKYIVEES